jgi:hypothetical protein
MTMPCGFLRIPTASRKRDDRRSGQTDTPQVLPRTTRKT